MLESISETAYEVKHRDGKLTWDVVSPNPILEYTKELLGPAAQASYGNALIMASYKRKMDVGSQYNDFEVWAAVRELESEQTKTPIPFSELAQKYEYIGIWERSQMLFPTVFDLLGFLSSYSNAFALSNLREISTHLQGQAIALREVLRAKAATP